MSAIESAGRGESRRFGIAACLMLLVLPLDFEGREVSFAWNSHTPRFAECVADDASSAPEVTSLEERLRLAIVTRDLGETRQCLESGADVRIADIIGNTALHNAVLFWGDAEVVRAILGAGAMVDAVNHNGETPLLAAIRWSHYRHDEDGPARVVSIVRELLSKGASAHAVDSNGNGAVSFAFDLHSVPLLTLLHEQGAILPDDAFYRALAPDTGSCDLAVVDFVKEHAEQRHLTARNAADATLLHVAAGSPRTLPLMQWLVERGADPHAVDSDGTTVFAEAAFSQNIAALEFLTEPNQRGASTPPILEIGAELEASTGEGHQPLHLAAYQPRYEVLSWLVQRGAALDARDRWGRRPLDVAIGTGRFASRDDTEKLRLITILGGSASDIARGTFVDHPLHVAARALDLDEIKRLLETGTDPNVRNESGETLLRTAIDYSSQLPATPEERVFGRKLLPLLIEYGANPTMRMGPDLRTYEEHAQRLGVAKDLARAMKKQGKKSPRH